MKFDLSHYKTKLVGNEDKRAVSPVIGVILMVAITVILAAVIAAFVLDIGDLDDSSPNAQFDWETEDDGDLVVAHTSGDNIDNLSITLSGEIAGEEPDDDIDGDEFTAGEEMRWEEDDVDDGEVALIWEGDGSSTTLTDYDYEYDP